MSSIFIDIFILKIAMLSYLMLAITIKKCIFHIDRAFLLIICKYQFANVKKSHIMNITQYLSAIYWRNRQRDSKIVRNQPSY